MPLSYGSIAGNRSSYIQSGSAIFSTTASFAQPVRDVVCNSPGPSRGGASFTDLKQFEHQIDSDVKADNDRTAPTVRTKKKLRQRLLITPL
ncbi:MAG: hypothetical protein E6614_01010 [Bradyrhizobium sp.]|jgi:hypothetical protein|uniref:Uncharacterized protein n=1 Tax=Bradyrhizobium denitrificans TaxID=2734912 RepID=A0ABS5G1F9_9BRAD|nr:MULTISPECIES: hypothetical protein [Bradyrhizobium]MBR1135104.1 hypothetical protein [Bradyrhizobium denitrificans]MDU0956331.1 hypothetical protein [Bradyrhizobium sp.]MDU1493990.1 hypothetical protein [Bradyrhizobium sp.]MDU1544148.1 hypothetical protein [Bradyrhizobium sp.]MDU1803642.1 hypothetical protein [Bradyrhizobium sp.]